MEVEDSTLSSANAGDLPILSDKAPRFPTQSSSFTRTIIRCLGRASSGEEVCNGVTLRLTYFMHFVLLIHYSIPFIHLVMYYSCDQCVH